MQVFIIISLTPSVHAQIWSLHRIVLLLLHYTAKYVHPKCKIIIVISILKVHAGS